MKLRPVALPFENVSILQDVQSQGISSDTEFLYRTITNEYPQKKTHHNWRVMELGTGNGVLSFMLALTCRNWLISALEAQVSLYLLARENIERCGVQIDLHLADLRKAGQMFNDKPYDLVLANPPYYQITAVRMSPSISRTISRTDILCSMDDLLLTLKRILHPKGRGFVLYPAARASEFRVKAERIGLQIIDEKTEEKTSDRERKTKTVFIIGHKTTPEKG